MTSRRVIVVGGGAAGFFAAITCAETAPDAEVTVLERSPKFLSKVRISGVEAITSDAITFKVLSAPLSQAQLAELIQIPPR